MPSASNGSILVDTNVLVYAVDRAEAGKARRAVDVIEAIAESGVGAINAQILAEFYSVAVRFRPGGAILAPRAAAQWVDRWLAIFDFRLITEMVVREAVRGARDHQMNIYDAQIWAAAKIGDIGLVLTEDAQSSPMLEGVRYVDPFADGFALAALGL